MLSLWFVKKRLWHRLKAKNRHGLHSPFVYRLVDDVIYDFKARMAYAEIEGEKKRSKQSIKTDQLLYRLLADQQPRNILLLGEIYTETQRYLQFAAPTAVFFTDSNGAPKFDLMLINSPDETAKYFEECLQGVHNDTMLIVNGIYQNNSNYQAWEQIKGRQEVTVTVDLFWIGLVFFRKGQVREDFWIRF